jgi:TonB-dependent starch-binding outer membrane protein SusC
MKKTIHGVECFPFFPNPGKILLFMKLTLFLSCVLSANLVASAYSQNARFNMEIKNQAVREVLKTIEKQSQFRFFYNDDFTDLDKMVTLTASDMSIDDVLSVVLNNTGVSYQVLENNFIVITPGKNYQQQKVSGTVTDATTGEPLPGVYVLIEGTQSGTITDAAGKFTMEVPPGYSRLAFSFMGFSSQTIDIAGKTSIAVALVSDVKQLEEVVVIGYGSQRKKDVTGAVETVTAKSLEDRPNNQFGYALAGKAAGVEVTRPSGQPQAGFSIRIRGTSTITAGSEPLYIVDGVPTTSTNDINPADIESLTILKDASSAAIYGASGANGVVLITTKRGKNQKTRVNLDTYMGFSNVWRKLDVLNGSQYKDLMTEMGQSVDWSLYTADNNWQDKVFRTAQSQNYQLGITGGNENTGFYISGSWMKQDGIVMTNTVNRYNFKTNLDHKVGNHLKVGTSIAYSRWKDSDVNENWKYGAITSLITGAPVTDVYNADGTFAINPFIQDLENPVALLLKNKHAYTNYRFNGNVYAEVNFLKDFKFRSMFGTEQFNSTYNAWVDPFTSREGRGFKGIADLYNHQMNYWISENTFSYSKVLNKHSINALAGFVASERSIFNSSVHATGFGSNAIQTVNGGSLRTAGADDSKHRNAAFIGRINYAYDDRYLLTTNFRADASTVFGAGQNMWGYFPSFSVGWRVSKEEFFKGLDFINDLKLRAGWGEVGNDQVSDYASYGLVSADAFYVIGGNVTPGTSPISLENRNLKWETTKQTDIGLDVSFLKNRMSFTTDYYIKKTTDMLLERPIPASVGIPSNVATKNIGEMQNKGVEFQVSSQNLVNTLKWSTDFNLSFNRSKILSLDGGTIKIGNISDRGAVAIAQEGQPLGMFYGYVSGGVDPATGDMIFLDLDHTGDLSDGDKKIIGNANPKFTFGLTNTFSYKAVSLRIFIQGVQGNKIFNATRIETEGLMDEANQTANVLRRWKTPGQVTDIPRSTFGDNRNSLISSRFIEDGSFVRVKSVTLGYELPSRLISKLSMSRLFIYVTSENLLTFTKYSGFDPEVSLYGRSDSNADKNIGPGVDYGTYPQSRDIFFGLNLSF